MYIVNIHEAKTHLSGLVERAAKGESFIIAKAGKPRVKVTALIRRQLAKHAVSASWRSRSPFRETSTAWAAMTSRSCLAGSHEAAARHPFAALGGR